jgi:Uncharacterized protein conserved in bacteria
VTDSGLIEQLRQLELELMDPVRRRDPATLAHLLTDDFIEFGKSGRVFNKAEILASIANPTGQGDTLQIEDFQVRLLAPNCVLATYRINVQAPGMSSLRSSVWIKGTKGWQMCFHQGTIASSHSQTGAAAVIEQSIEKMCGILAGQGLPEDIEKEPDREI